MTGARDTDRVAEAVLLRWARLELGLEEPEPGELEAMKDTAARLEQAQAEEDARFDRKDL